MADYKERGLGTNRSPCQCRTSAARQQDNLFSRAAESSLMTRHAHYGCLSCFFVSPTARHNTCTWYMLGTAPQCSNSVAHNAAFNDTTSTQHVQQAIPNTCNKQSKGCRGAAQRASFSAQGSVAKSEMSHRCRAFSAGAHLINGRALKGRCFVLFRRYHSNQISFF